MSALPIDESPKLRQAAQIADGLKNGEEMLQNPLNPNLAILRDNANNKSILVDTILQTPGLSTANAQVMTNLQTAMNSATGQIGAFQAHTDALIFGDDAGSFISGGITATSGMALSAVSLNDTFATLNGVSTQGCGLLDEFFGSLLGAGQELLNLLGEGLQALQDAAGEVFALVQEYVGLADAALQAALQAVSGAINAAIAAATTAINQALGQIASVAAQIADRIASELSAFAEWLARQLDFGLGSFLSSVFDNECFQSLAGSISTPALTAILG